MEQTLGVPKNKADFESGTTAGLLCSILYLLVPIFIAIGVVGQAYNLVEAQGSTDISAYYGSLTGAVQTLVIISDIFEILLGLLFLYSSTRLDRYYQNKRIQRYALWGLILTSIQSAFLVVFSPFAVSSMLLPGGIAQAPLQFRISNWLLSLLGYGLYLLAFQQLTIESHDDKFIIAGIILLIGGLLEILSNSFGLLMFLAWIVAAYAYYSLKRKEAQSNLPPYLGIPND